VKLVDVGRRVVGPVALLALDELHLLQHGLQPVAVSIIRRFE
jgi:hypothetical protein